MLPVEVLGAPMDVLWFKLPKADDGGDALRGSVQPGRMVVLIDRDDYWQAAFLIPKGEEAKVRAQGPRMAPRARSRRPFPTSISRAISSSAMTTSNC